MEVTCTTCKRTVSLNPADQHGRVRVKNQPSVLQCTCGKHLFKD